MLMDSSSDNPYQEHSSSTWHLELVLTVAVGSVLVATLLMCYVYVFRQLCCPPPRRGHRRQRYKQGVNAGYPADALEQGLMPLGRSTRMESLPMTNVTSQPTETDRV